MCSDCTYFNLNRKIDLGPPASEVFTLTSFHAWWKLADSAAVPFERRSVKPCAFSFGCRSDQSYCESGHCIEKKSLQSPSLGQVVHKISSQHSHYPHVENFIGQCQFGEYTCTIWQWLTEPYCPQTSQWIWRYGLWQWFHFRGVCVSQLSLHCICSKVGNPDSGVKLGSAFHLNSRSRLHH